MAPRDMVKRNKEKLINAISPKVVSVAHELFLKRVIDRPMMETLCDNGKPHHEKARDLLELIVSLEPMASEHLYDTVIEAELYEAADMFIPENTPRESYMGAQLQPQTEVYNSSDETEEDDSPDETEKDDFSDERPLDYYIIAYNAVRLVGVKRTRMIEEFKDMLTPKGQRAHYLMSAKPRGQVLIINNEEFTHMTNRDGSSADRKSLEELFKSLYFDVAVAKNMTKEGMWKLLEEESRRDYHNTAQCFVLSILSHGDTGVVFGTDGHMMDGQPVNCLQIKDIVDLFCRSKALQGKPKLFFIQACQGDEKNEGHPVGHTQAGDSTVSRQPASDCIPLSDEDDTEEDRIISETRATLNEVFGMTEAYFARGKRRSDAHVFVASATIPDFILYQNKEHGTLFIQAICYVFAKHSHILDLNTMMNRVNFLVREVQRETGRYKKICQTDLFRKVFYFFPGLHA